MNAARHEVAYEQSMVAPLLDLLVDAHARLHGIAIRHWDGYWFGADRLGKAILRADMANYSEDASATCAFVMPSTVDGRRAHRADPM
ncbi:hypothetical protein GCM10010129_01250 [Streptomyces fumigatiscleroticus]|nr:hypothetical protein GCM10010129_01250 [Streptomyces fumigatiscleroticus]